MKLNITIEVAGAALNESPAEEARRILHDRLTADRLRTSQGGPLRDVNGNTVGRWEWAD